MFGECVCMIVHALTTGLCILDCSYNLADTTGSSLQHESFTTDKIQCTTYSLDSGLCHTVRPQDTRPQAAPPLTMHVFE